MSLSFRLSTAWFSLALILSCGCGSSSDDSNIRVSVQAVPEQVATQEVPTASQVDPSPAASDDSTPAGKSSDAEANVATELNAPAPVAPTEPPSAPPTSAESASVAATEPEPQPVASGSGSDTAVGSPVTETATEPQSTEPQPVETQQVETQPPTVAELVAAMNLTEFPKPGSASSNYVTQSTLFYETSDDLDTTYQAVSDEFLKRGFTGDDPIETHSASITILVDDRPMTMWMSSSVDDNATIVRVNHHQGADVSNVPVLPLEGTVHQRVDEMYYVTPMGVPQGEIQLRTELNTKEIPIARTSRGNGKSRVFEKDGIRFLARVEESESTEYEMEASRGTTKAVRVVVLAVGSTDLALLPRPDDFEVSSQDFNALAGHRTYTTAAKPADASKRASELLADQGWIPVESIRPSIADSQRLLIRNGSLLTIQASQFEDGHTRVQYSLGMLPCDLPPDVDTRMVRVDTAAPNLFFSTSADMDDITEFYSQHLPAIGWKVNPKFEFSEPAAFMRVYEASYFEPVLLEVTRRSADTTWMQVRPVGLDGLAGIFATTATEAAEEEAPPEEAVEEPANVAETTPATTPDSDRVAGSTPPLFDPTEMDVAEFARNQLEAALKDVPEDQAANIRNMLENSLNEAFDTASRTETSPTETSPVETSPVETSEEWEAEEPIDATAQTDPPEQPEQPEDHAETPSPPEDTIAADAFPIPNGAQEVTRDFEMITFGVDDVKTNAEFIRQQLLDRGWTRRGEEMIESDMALMTFQKGTGTINVTLTLDDRRDPPVHTVIQGDGLWFADSDTDAEFADDEAWDDEPDASDGPTEFEGLALPKGIESPIRMSTSFRSEFVTSVESDLKSVFEFFQQAADGDWETKSENLQDDKSASMTLANDDGEMVVNLKRFEGEIEISLAFRNPKLAAEAGFVPNEGLGRLILANGSDAEATIVINNRSYKLAPQRGAEDPKDGIILNIKPGRYNYTIKGAGRDEQSGQIRAIVGGTWAVMVFPEQGHMAERMY